MALAGAEPPTSGLLPADLDASVTPVDTADDGRLGSPVPPDDLVDQSGVLPDELAAAQALAHTISLAADILTSQIEDHDLRALAESLYANSLRLDSLIRAAQQTQRDWLTPLATEPSPEPPNTTGSDEPPPWRIPVSGVIAAGAIRMDLDGRDVWVGDDRVQIPHLQYELLRVLVANAGRVLPHAELQQLAWGRRVLTANTLYVNVRRVREALALGGAGQDCIVVVRGKGYKLTI
jgi:hypothetical protein